MTRDEVSQAILMRATLDFPRLKELHVKENDLLGDDLGLDSLDMIEMVLSIEEGLGVDIPEDEIKSVRSVKEVIDIFYDKLKEKDA